MKLLNKFDTILSPDVIVQESIVLSPFVGRTNDAGVAREVGCGFARFKIDVDACRHRNWHVSHVSFYHNLIALQLGTFFCVV